MNISEWHSFNLCKLFLVSILVFHPIPLSADSVSTKTYRELTEIQELMSSATNENLGLKTAIDRLKLLLTEVANGSLDEALTLQTLGYAVMSDENFEEAITYLKRSLDTEKLPQNVVYNVGYMVAQLHAALGQFQDALVFAEKWFVQLEQPKADQYIFMANIHAQVKNHAQSIPYAEEAISLAEKPKATWFQLLAANFFELDRFGEAALILIDMTSLWPDNTAYWEQLAGVYMVMEKPQKALATLKIAFDLDLLEKESSLKSLVQLALMQGIPEHAARLLEDAIAAELLPLEEQYLDMQAQAWVMARESEKAVLTLKKLTELQDGGEAWMRIAQIHVENTEWSEARAAISNALKKDLDSPGRAWLLLGIAQSELGMFNDARSALRRAKAFEDTARSAKAWMRYSEDMKRQAAWITSNQ
jgi:tetratricopeptide (TPR) repeat protein